MMFARGECDILVSTSVMERGITVEGVDVIVLDADWEAASITGHWSRWLDVPGEQHRTRGERLVHLLTREPAYALLWR